MPDAIRVLLVPPEAYATLMERPTRGEGGSAGACSRGNFKAPETIVRQRSRVFLVYLESTGAFRGGGLKYPRIYTYPFDYLGGTLLGLPFFLLRASRKRVACVTERPKRGAEGEGGSKREA